MSSRPYRLLLVALLLACVAGPSRAAPPQTAAEHDPLRELQADAIRQGRAEWGYWGSQPARYTGWTTHSNRLIPVYTFGLGLNSVRDEHSPYRNTERLQQLYGRLPEGTLNPQANYFDQTDIYRLQQTAIAAGKKRIILFIFDGLDWQTTWAAAIYRTGEVRYREGRGSGLHLQDYRGAATDFGLIVTSPHNEGTLVDVNAQSVRNAGGLVRGGYDWQRGGEAPWSIAEDPLYLIGKSNERLQAYTDSSSSATSMTAGIKTYNEAVNVDAGGRQVDTIAHQMQRRGWSVGAVSSVPISHATPAAAYAHNVFRDDYQDLTRDLIGLRSIAHPQQPLPGLDVLIGTGWSENAAGGRGRAESRAQGNNFVPGNRYLAADDLKTVDVEHGGKYRVVQRTAGSDGAKAMAAAAADAVTNHSRLLGFFGAAATSHLPFRTADGKYDPTVGVKNSAERYSAADLSENPRLTDFALAALEVLSQNRDGFWLMIEAGDVDWANHDNNLDNSIGAVLDGDDAVRAVTDWIEQHGGWEDTALIVTADHGHYLHLTRPEAIAEAAQATRKSP